MLDDGGEELVDPSEPPCLKGFKQGHMMTPFQCESFVTFGI
jgi:hypothetical protein